MGRSEHLYSIVVPVYNRPDELKQLLDSIANQRYNRNFEIVVVEDGSEFDSRQVCEESPISSKIHYYFTPNSGPGDSRNFGMRKASGDYFILVDSDCILPENYLNEVDRSLIEEYADFFGGPDAALPTFTLVQKAVNMVMTSKMSTGGIRGKSSAYFEPRSFNMGLSRAVFEATGGFSSLHPGEDPELVMRAWKLGFKSRLLKDAVVYHQRRIRFDSFFKQVYKFGSVRPILEQWHPEFKRWIYKAPALFLLYLLSCLAAGLAFMLDRLSLFTLSSALLPLIVYLGLFKLQLLYQTRSLKLTALSVFAFFLQMIGYALGYIRVKLGLWMNRSKPVELIFPHLFFKPLIKD